MALRQFVVFVYVIAFFLAIVSVVSIPQYVWQYMSLRETLVLVFSLLAGFCGVLLAYFVYVDGAILEKLQETAKPKERKDIETS